MIDKIIKELEESAFEVDTRDYGRLYVVDIECAIEIVKKYENDEWVSVKDRFPEPIEENNYKTSGFVNFKDEDGKFYYGYYDYEVGNWVLDEDIWIYEVVAWQPLPSTYKEVQE